MKIREDASATAVATEPRRGKTRVAINGLGRIGRTFLKLALERDELDIAAVNDIGDAGNLAYLLRFDSVYGRYTKPVAVDRVDGVDYLRIGDHSIRMLQERDPSRLPWRALDIDVVVEAT